MNSLLAQVAHLAEDAGALLREEFARGSAVRSEAGRDIKLEADVRAERRILAGLRALAPHPVLAEEQGADPSFSTEREYWVVDPLDGTLNFSRRVPLCCVSIALWRGPRPVLGVIHDFIRGETFSGLCAASASPTFAATAAGAWNATGPIHPSRVNSLSQAVLGTGFPTGRRFDEASLLAFCREVQQFKKVRLLGSAALSLAWVACGRMDAYAEDDIWFWDVAAGLALVAAAGGAIECRPGSQPHQRCVRATNGALPWPAAPSVSPA